MRSGSYSLSPITTCWVRVRVTEHTEHAAKDKDTLAQNLKSWKMNLDHLATLEFTAKVQTLDVSGLSCLFKHWGNRYHNTSASLTRGLKTEEDKQEKEEEWKCSTEILQLPLVVLENPSH